mmetsp:Transcript_18202/g.69008  ORF Transcript_18202/g.69008 Transcript_18202/m.69008 type:complete len:254 (+) Transcript_18202:1133-1894(+)
MMSEAVPRSRCPSPWSPKVWCLPCNPSTQWSEPGEPIRSSQWLRPSSSSSQAMTAATFNFLCTTSFPRSSRISCVASKCRAGADRFGKRESKCGGSSTKCRKRRCWATAAAIGNVPRPCTRRPTSFTRGFGSMTPGPRKTMLTIFARPVGCFRRKRRTCSVARGSCLRRSLPRFRARPATGSSVKRPRFTRRLRTVGIAANRTRNASKSRRHGRSRAAFWHQPYFWSRGPLWKRSSTGRPDRRSSVPATQGPS